jgi:hypothetical protein
MLANISLPQQEMYESVKAMWRENQQPEQQYVQESPFN